MKRDPHTRVAAILGVTFITMLGMYLRIDGVLMPMFGVATISGVAGYRMGVEKSKEIAETVKEVQ